MANKTLLNSLKNLSFLPWKKRQKGDPIFQSQALLMISLFIFAVYALYHVWQNFPTQSLEPVPVRGGISQEKILTVLNFERKKAGLQPLRENRLLEEAAEAKAYHMFQNQYWGHNSPQGKEAWDFLQTAGYLYSYAAENLARDFSNTDALLTAWMDSETHRSNILDKKYTETGIAVLRGRFQGRESTFIVQIFATASSVILVEGEDTGIYTLPRTAEANSDVSGKGRLSQSWQNLNHQLRFSQLTLSKTFFLLLILILIISLIYDAIFIKSHRYQRIVGENFAHICLLVMVFLLILLFREGQVFP